jgi:DNA-binding CsgD family transcriptional regulator
MTTKLSPRERQIAYMIARGMHNRANSQKLGIAYQTVRHHCSNIFLKLGTKNRTQTAVLVLMAGLPDDN